MDDRPPVTISDPSRPGGRPDLLSSAADDEEPRVGPAARRRLLAAAAALALLVVGATEVRERRQERRSASLVALEVVDAQGPDGASSSDGRTVSLELAVRLRNTGARPVTVLSGGVGDYGVVRPAVLPAGQTTTVRLERRVACGPTPPPDAATGGTLALAVRTGAGPRRVALPLLLTGDRGGAAAACGFRPDEQDVALAVAGSADQPRAVVLSLELSTGAAEEVSLLGARVDDGLDVALRETDGTPVGLPRPLPVPSAGSRVGLLLEAVVTVTDCRRAREVGAPALRMALADDGGRVVEVSAGYEPGVVRSLVARSC